MAPIRVQKLISNHLITVGTHYDAFRVVIYSLFMSDISCC